MNKTQSIERLPYKQGDWFAVPLEDGGYCLGFAARVDGKGGIIGYFFGPRRDSVPSVAEIPLHDPSDAILIKNFGDLGFLENKWPIIGRKSGCDPVTWHIPLFWSEDPVTGQTAMVRYDEANLAREIPVSRRLLSADERKTLPRAGIAGAGFVEGVLTDALRKTDLSDVGTSKTPSKRVLHSRRLYPMEYYFYFTDRVAAESASETLRELHHDVHIERAAQGDKWLLLAGCEFKPVGKEELELIDKAMTKVAKEYGGEYDGWQAEVSNEES